MKNKTVFVETTLELFLQGLGSSERVQSTIDSSPASFPGTIMTGADLQLWKQYSLTLPCSTLHKYPKENHRLRKGKREEKQDIDHTTSSCFCIISYNQPSY